MHPHSYRPKPTKRKETLREQVLGVVIIVALAAAVVAFDYFVNGR